MGVRPPTGDSTTERVEFGLPVLAEHLDESDLDFPANEREVLGAVEVTDIPYDAAGNTVGLAQALEECSSEEFDSRTQLLDELYPIFERRRENTANSLLSRLRTLWPL